MSGYTGPERRQHRPWSLGRRADDRKWPRFARDLWLVIVTGITLVSVSDTSSLTGRVAHNQQANTQALCALRGDLQQRVADSQDFLDKHPRGIPGIPVATIRQSITNADRTITALQPVPCPRPKHPKHQKHR